MSIGGVNSNNFGNPNQGASSSGAQGDSAGKEFALEQQNSGELIKSDAAKANAGQKGRVTKIVGNKKRNRKGAPRAVLVDGEIWEVYLLAIA